MLDFMGAFGYDAVHLLKNSGKQAQFQVYDAQLFQDSIVELFSNNTDYIDMVKFFISIFHEGTDLVQEVGNEFDKIICIKQAQLWWDSFLTHVLE